MDVISYLYNYSNPAYDRDNAFKNGSTTNLPSRLGVYKTHLIDPGFFTEAYKFHGTIDGHSTAEYVENKLHHYLVNQNKHVYRGGGTEFFLNDSVILIEPFLETLQIPYTKLSPVDIERLSRPPVVACPTKSQIISPLIKAIHHKKHIQTHDQNNNVQEITEYVHIDPSNEPVATEHQLNALNRIDELLSVYRILKLYWACGLGKALLSIFAVKRRNFQTVAIGVPSKYLQKQMQVEILKLFPYIQNILFVGGDSVGMTTSTNDPLIIRKFLTNTHTHGPRFIITTYHSSHILANMESIVFDLKIGDEAHHLASVATHDPSRRTFQRFHAISSHYTLFMTATEKIVDCSSGSEVFSMEDEAVFGKLVDSISVKWAIENRKITDYNVVLIKNREEDIDALLYKLQIENANKDLFLSAYMSVKSIEKYSSGRNGTLTHMLLYTNTTEDADLVNQYIRQIVEYTHTDETGNQTHLVSFRQSDLYAKSLHSSTEDNICLKTELDKFIDSRFGIISCVFMFGEGFDLPKLNGVCIASNMRSEIRVVQYVLRPNRIDRTNPDKMAYVIIPVLDTDDFACDTSVRYGRVKEIISQLRNMDETVSSKLHLLEMKPKQNPGVDTPAKSKATALHFDMFESPEELSKITLRLRYSKALGSTHTQEQDEYEYVRSLNRQFGINSQQKYIDMKDKHPHYIENPDIYFPETWRGRYHFWGVDTSRFIQSREEWIRFCREKKVKNVREYESVCNMYPELPFDPASFYKGFSNIYNELQEETRRR